MTFGCYPDDVNYLDPSMPWNWPDPCCENCELEIDETVPLRNKCLTAHETYCVECCAQDCAGPNENCAACVAIYDEHSTTRVVDAPATPDVQTNPSTVLVSSEASGVAIPNGEAA